MYWFRKHFHIEAGSLKEPVSGVLQFLAEPVVERSDRSEAAVTQFDSSHWAVRFRIADRGHLTVSHRPNPVVGWPVILALDSDPGEVSVGRPGDHPTRESTLRLHDYHALAVHDLNGDSRPDIVALGGGMRGRAAELLPDAVENTFLSTLNGYVFVPGPTKLGYATRMARWVGDALRVLCARDQVDNQWRWFQSAVREGAGGAGEWRGGAAGSSSYRQQEIDCRDFAPVRSGRLHVTEGALCVAGDFHQDGLMELVVATPGADRVNTTTVYYGLL